MTATAVDACARFRRPFDPGDPTIPSKPGRPNLSAPMPERFEARAVRGTGYMEVYGPMPESYYRNDAYLRSFVGTTDWAVTKALKLGTHKTKRKPRATVYLPTIDAAAHSETEPLYVYRSLKFHAAPLIDSARKGGVSQAAFLRDNGHVLAEILKARAEHYGADYDAVIAYIEANAPKVAAAITSPARPSASAHGAEPSIEEKKRAKLAAAIKRRDRATAEIAKLEAELGVTEEAETCAECSLVATTEYAGRPMCQPCAENTAEMERVIAVAETPAKMPTVPDELATRRDRRAARRRQRVTRQRAKRTRRAA